jgi:hypothetical protein
MSEPGRPPLHATVFEKIDRSMYEVDQKYWPLILAFRAKTYYPPNTPVPPPTPQLLMNEIYAYASILFAIEANEYDALYSSGHYLDWLFRLADRVVARVLTNLDRLNDGGPNLMLLEYHGLQRAEIERELRDFLRSISGDYERRKSSLKSIAPISPTEPETTSSINPTSKPAVKRLSSQIYSPSAAAKMAAYMNKKALNQTEFSIQAGTSDKTVRRFIKTGYIKRSILIGIAAAMRVSKDDLIS